MAFLPNFEVGGMLAGFSAGDLTRSVLDKLILTWPKVTHESVHFIWFPVNFQKYVFEK
jgi:hypothetical protein